ncbi:MAG: major capsid protein [Microviridae sp.]|nr:MAG: major capsid protein [Microviridae sp.]
MSNRNTESHFSVAPASLDMGRSRFDRSCSYKTSFNVGDLIPFFVDEVLPGDTFALDTSMVVRLQTLLTPMMDNLYLDTYYFFVPNRLVWSHWKELMGENTSSAWIPSVEYSVPQVTSPTGGWSAGTIADYFGVPTGVDNLSISALPFRAYALICNEWFRDQNLLDPLNIPVTDAAVAGSNGDNYITDIVKGGKPFVAAKFHDYFTSCLPGPQKAPDVLIPQGTSGQLPVYALNTAVPSVDAASSLMFGVSNAAGAGSNRYASQSGSGSNLALSETDNISGSGNSRGVYPLNLWAVGSGAAAGATINQLRLAFQLQKLYEKDARSGTRYIEVLKAHFGVTSPDARLQRPEYLGGKRIPITVNQIVQQSQTTESSPMGDVAGQSLTTDYASSFTHSFVEHGFVIGLCVARYDHTYQQGLNRMWSRKTRFDFYWPTLANIGEQPVLNKEIYAQGSGVVNSDTGKPYDDEVFGYQEAWADYRYKPNTVTGEMRSQYAQSLDSWHLADDYNSLPMLSASWIKEDANTVNRVLAVSSSVSNQLFGDFYIKNLVTRVMPLYSVPGLIDHH